MLGLLISQISESPRLTRSLMTDMSIGLPLISNGLTPSSKARWFPQFTASDSGIRATSEGQRGSQALSSRRQRWPRATAAKATESPKPTHRELTR